MSQGIDKVADCLPLLPLKDIVVFPQMILPVFVSEDICMRAVEAACAKDRFIFYLHFVVKLIASMNLILSLELQHLRPSMFMMLAQSLQSCVQGNFQMVELKF